MIRPASPAWFPSHSHSGTLTHSSWASSNLPLTHSDTRQDPHLLLPPEGSGTRREARRACTVWAGAQQYMRSQRLALTACSQQPSVLGDNTTVLSTLGVRKPRLEEGSDLPQLVTSRA